ncbi:MAG: alpha/beta hydrolase [Phycicoccus sp.]|nr:alpha/beta hydrolase [Phycicoccus sp.]
MPPRTALLTRLIDTARRPPVDEMSLADIRWARTVLHPRRRPFTWLLGELDPTLVVGAATALARDGASIPLRTYRPADRTGPLPVVVWLHGGGWVLGNVVNYDPICSDLATTVDALVVSVDYRLAPEHRAPTAALDAIDATRWVVEHAAGLGADPDRIAVAGDSAGGNLAALVAQAFRDEQAPNVRAQVLIYPAVDMTKSAPSLQQHPNGGILTAAAIDAFLDHYLGDEVDPLDPLVSPLFGDLTGLAPALIQTADLDPIRDDGSRYAAALTAAGSSAHWTNYRGVPHGFASFPGASPAGAAQRREMTAFLLHHLRPSVG